MRELERRVCCRCSTASGASTSTRWTTCARASTCVRYSQRDPLVEYQREGFDMFVAIMDGIKEESVGFLFNLEVSARRRRGATRRRSRSRSRCAGSSPTSRPPAPTTRSTPTTRWSPPAPPSSPTRRSSLRPRRSSAAPRSRPRGSSRPRQPQKLSYSAPVRGRRGRGQGLDGDRRPTTRSPRWAATRSAPAARARSTRCATAGRADPPGSPPAPPGADPGHASDVQRRLDRWLSGRRCRAETPPCPYRDHAELASLRLDA